MMTEIVSKILGMNPEYSDNLFWVTQYINSNISFSAQKLNLQYIVI